jgi:hypothetical protein
MRGKNVYRFDAMLDVGAHTVCGQGQGCEFIHRSVKLSCHVRYNVVAAARDTRNHFVAVFCCVLTCLLVLSRHSIHDLFSVAGRNCHGFMMVTLQIFGQGSDAVNGNERATKREKFVHENRQRGSTSSYPPHAMGAVE